MTRAEAIGSALDMDMDCLGDLLHYQRNGRRLGEGSRRSRHRDGVGASRSARGCGGGTVTTAGRLQRNQCHQNQEQESTQEAASAIHAAAHPHAKKYQTSDW